MKNRFLTKIITDGNYNHVHGFALPSAMAIKRNEIIGFYSGFANLEYPCNVTAECAAIKLGFDMALNYCDKRQGGFKRGSVVVENDNRSLIDYLNGKKLIKKNGMTAEIERMLEQPKRLQKEYRIKVGYAHIGKELPHAVGKEIESVILNVAKNGQNSV